jgi:hypothetical protein
LTLRAWSQTPRASVARRAREESKLEASPHAVILAAVPDDQRLFDLLRLHTEEVRFQVNLTWDRAKSSLAFHAAWIAILANLTGKKDVVPPYLIFLMFAFAGISAFLGGEMVRIGHKNYRSARDRRKGIEQAMGTAYGIVTTPGDRGEGPWRTKIHVIIIAMHILMGLLALMGAWMFRPR